MKYILVLVLATIVGGVQAQDCKFESKEKDKFTGKTKVTNVYVLGGHFWYMTKMDTAYTIELKSKEFKGAMQQGIEKGSKAQFRLANGEFVSFTASEAVEPVVKVVGTEVKSTYRVVYNMAPSELARLSQSAPVAFNLPLGGVNDVNDIPEKKGVSMQTTAKCMLEFKE
jgi:hypothetical protein